MKVVIRFFALILLLACQSGCQSPATSEAKKAEGSSKAKPAVTNLWDMQALAVPPKFTKGQGTGLIQEIYYEGVPYQGKPTQVFAYLGKPEGKGPFPAMVLVHGGGGQAFANWADMWAKRGYVALAMDTAGCGPNKIRLVDGGPDQTDLEKFMKLPYSSVQDMWTYQAVAAVIRGHSLLASLPEVDANRIGITGISWGGYLTCIVAGMDHRLKCAIPVYGSGYLWEDSAWLNQFKELGPKEAQRWCELFDPSVYLPQVQCPTLFVNRPTDFHYRLGVYQKSFRLVPAPKTLHLNITMKHSHQAGWAPEEIAYFADSILQKGAPLPTVGDISLVGKSAVAAPCSSPLKLNSGQLCYTTDMGPFEARIWHAIPAKITGETVSATLPEDRPLTFYLNVTDERGATASSTCKELRVAGQPATAPAPASK